MVALSLKGTRLILLGKGKVDRHGRRARSITDRAEKGGTRSLRVVACASASLLILGTGLLVVPCSRHLLRREWARITPVRFSTAKATKVVPIAVEMPPSTVAGADPRFSGRPASEQAVPALRPPLLDAAAFATPAIAGTVLGGAEPIDGTAGGVGAAATQDASLSIDFANARQALQSYRKGDLAAGDDFARPTTGPLRTLLDWAAIRLDSRGAGVARLEAFVAAHPDWPALPWVRRRIEEAKASSKDAAAVLALFATAPPTTLFGRIALAKADIATGRIEAGAAIVRTVWRDDDLTSGQEASLLKEFGSILRKEDHKARADRLIYKEDVPSGLRSAALAGPDVVLLERARVAVIASAPSDAAFAAIPKPLTADPGLIFAKVQKARRANRIAEASQLLLTAPRDPALVIDGDAWWVERRLVARKLLDIGDAKTAYRICADHSASSVQSRIEAEFHAGWIALRFLSDPSLAIPHFAAAAAIAESPISVSRAAYWQGRAAQAAGDPAAAAKFFEAAADQSATFYGQLAAAEVGRTAPTRSTTAPTVDLGQQHDGTRAVSLLLALDERDLAVSLAQTLAKTDPDPIQVAAAAQAIAASGDAKATLLVGKAAAQRGIALDDAAFPTFGIPGFQPLTRSADLSTVYAIARQESEFDQRSVSSAGARGLMQLISATARKTAERAGVDYSDAKLSTDAAFNAQIGAAHLGKLLADEGGSYILTFAAYNAGAGKVQEWIAAYGDPRKPGVDPIDWIERIPFTETRNYVQRVFENMQVYRTRFGMPAALLTEAARPMPSGGAKGT